MEHYASMYTNTRWDILSIQFQTNLPNPFGSAFQPLSMHFFFLLYFFVLYFTFSFVFPYIFHGTTPANRPGIVIILRLHAPAQKATV